MQRLLLHWWDFLESVLHFSLYWMSDGIIKSHHNLISFSSSLWLQAPVYCFLKIFDQYRIEISSLQIDHCMGACMFWSSTAASISNYRMSGLHVGYGYSQERAQQMGDMLCAVGNKPDRYNYPSKLFKGCPDAARQSGPGITKLRTRTEALYHVVSINFKGSLCTNGMFRCTLYSGKLMEFITGTLHPNNWPTDGYKR